MNSMATIRSILLAAITGTTLALAGCGNSPENSEAPFVPAPATPATSRTVLNILPPGQSGHYSSQGQTAGSGSGNPADFGPHVDDQREMYWSFQFKPGEFLDITNLTPTTPQTGTAIYRDDFGVPVVYGDSSETLWYGVGYAVAEDRMFLLDAARRQGRGEMSALLGPEWVPFDIQQRTLTYTQAEYDAMYANLSDEAKTVAQAYVDGVNARIAEVNADPNLRPAEYSLLSSAQIEPVDVTDVVASGVLITRFVASAGGDEMQNVVALNALENLHGDQTRARSILKDVKWQDDTKAAVTIPTGQTFTNITTPPANRDAVFDAMATFAATVPEELATGNGTGDAPIPTPPFALNHLFKSMMPAQYAAATHLSKTIGFNKVGRAKGASYLVAIDETRTQTAGPMLISGPQLGYSYPLLLVEYEVHGGGYDARGTSVPMLPVVGIGYGERTAWALTTGNSKTIDSFIVDTNPSNPNQYMYNGVWTDMVCRTEVINFRSGVGPLPFGPAANTHNEEVCRTVHGPIVSRHNNKARAVQYGMWLREVETIEAVLTWNRVDTFAEFHASMEKATWNENLAYADADGNIAYYHPGLHPRRHANVDQRLPIPGDGSFDHNGELSFAELPKSINPAQGWLTNWNNKPSHGWGDGSGGNAASLPGGAEARVTNWQTLLAADSSVSLTELLAMEKDIGLRDPRAKGYVPLLNAQRASNTLLTPSQVALLNEVVDNWDQYHYNTAIDINDETATDTPGATIFDYVVRELRRELLETHLPAELLTNVSAVGNHEYDAPGVDTLVLKVFDPSISSIPLNFDFTQTRVAPNVYTARTLDEIFAAAVTAAELKLQTDFASTTLTDFTRVHHRDEVCSLTGGTIGPCITMPHQDRGSWIHIVSFE